MADVRSLYAVLSDMEEMHHDIERLALAVDAIGSHSLVDVTTGGRYAGAVEILGELIGERAQRLALLISEGHTLRGAVAHG